MPHLLIDASLPRPTGPLVVSYRHTATDVRDIGMATATDQQIAAHAQANQMSLLSRIKTLGMCWITRRTSIRGLSSSCRRPEQIVSQYWR